MPNRIIKESITTSCEINSLSPEEEVFFYRLIVSCDDFGRMDGRTAVVRAKCFPLRVDRVKDVSVKKWVTALISADLIATYIVDNKPYIQIKKWDKHQQRRAKHSKYPAPVDGMISDDINGNQAQSNVPEESRNRGIEESVHGQNFHDNFEQLWKLYPEKKGKARISDTKKKELHKHGYDAIAMCIERYINDVAAKRNNGFKDLNYQNGSTFFNSGYIDYLDDNYNPAEQTEQSWGHFTAEDARKKQEELRRTGGAVK